MSDICFFLKYSRLPYIFFVTEQNCQRSCCETGFEYPDSTTTVDPEYECSAYTDEDAICVGVSDESDCSSAEFSGCFYSCCTLGNPIQTRLAQLAHC